MATRKRTPLPPSEERLRRAEGRTFAGIRDEHLKLDRAAFADVAGLHKETIRKWERGENPIPKWVWVYLTAIARNLPDFRTALASRKTVKKPAKNMPRPAPRVIKRSRSAQAAIAAA